MKNTQNEKLLVIYNEIEKEKKNAEELKFTPQKIKSIENRTLQKLKKINIDVLNFDFSLSEIFS